MFIILFQKKSRMKSENRPFQCVEYVHGPPFASTYLCVCRSLSRILLAAQRNMQQTISWPKGKVMEQIKKLHGSLMLRLTMQVNHQKKLILMHISYEKCKSTIGVLWESERPRLALICSILARFSFLRTFLPSPFIIATASPI